MVTRNGRSNEKYWALIDQCVQSGTNFLTMVLAARFLSVGAFAQFSLAYLAVLFAASFHRTWITQPMNVLGGQFPQDLPARAMALWRAHGVIGLGGVILVSAISPFGFAEPWIVAAASAYVVMFFLQEMRRRYAYTVSKIRAASIATTTMGLAQLSILGAFAMLGNHDPAQWLLVLALVQAVGILVGRALVPFALPARQRTARAVLGEQFRHSRWVIASQLVFWTSSQIYPFIIGVNGLAQAATFNAGMSILNAANVIRMTLANFMPAQTGKILRQHGEAELCRYTRRLLLQMVVAGMGALAVLQLLAEPAVTVLYGSKFPGAVDVLRWVALGVWASMFSVILNATALALEATQNIFVSNAVGAIFTCTAGIYFTHRYGLTGAIWSNVVGYTIPAAIQFVALWPRIRSTT